MTAAETTARAPALPTPRLPLDGVVHPAPAELPGGGRPLLDGERSRRRLLRLPLYAALVLAFLATCAVQGMPTDRVVLLGWVVAGLGLHAALDGLRRLARLVVDWVPLAAVLLVYDASRGLADGFGAPVHVTELVTADRWLFGGALPTVVLQRSWDAEWWHALASLVYASHFVVTPVLLGVLWVRDRGRWKRFAALVVGLSAAGLVTYVLYPAAPPWLAAKDGVIEPIRRLSGAGWEVLGLPRAGALLADSQGQVNQVAALPSLHTGFAVLVCLVLLPVARRTWQRVGLIAYAVLMPVVLVWSGEHYVVDTLLGAAYAGGVVGAAALVRRAWERRRTAVVPTVAV
jgi:hypothetical protein